MKAFIARIFVWFLGSERRHFVTAIKYKDDSYVITVDKYRSIKDICYR